MKYDAIFITPKTCRKYKIIKLSKDRRSIEVHLSDKKIKHYPATNYNKRIVYQYSFITL